MTPILLICATMALSDGDSGWCHRADAERVRVRLSGMDAGEVAPYTRCRRQPHIWACSPIGRETAPLARARARELTSNGADCLWIDTDQYRRPVVTCTVDGVDVASVLVSEGLAINDPAYSPSYDREEQAARRARRGAWR
jgi:endonuclease YncB( thermonuclease family)